jgi:hypothetical protein
VRIPAIIPLFSAMENCPGLEGTWRKRGKESNKFKRWRPSLLVVCN